MHQAELLPHLPELSMQLQASHFLLQAEMQSSLLPQASLTFRSGLTSIFCFPDWKKVGVIN